MAKRKENKGGNSKLKGKSWNVPDYALNAIGNAVKTYETLQKEDIESENTTEGYKRAKTILEVKNLKYEHVKKIKRGQSYLNFKIFPTIFVPNVYYRSCYELG